ASVDTVAAKIMALFSEIKAKGSLVFVKESLKYLEDLLIFPITFVENLKKVATLATEWQTAQQNDSSGEISVEKITKPMQKLTCDDLAPSAIKKRIIHSIDQALLDQIANDLSQQVHIFNRCAPLTREEYCRAVPPDVTIYVGETEFKAHKSI